MAAPRKFGPQTRERAVRMYQDRMRESGDSKRAARRHVGELLGINEATLRNWVEDRYGTVGRTSESGGDARDDEMARLRKENTELRRANEILKTASAFFAAAEIDRRLR